MRKYRAKTIITPRLKIRKPRMSDATDMFNNWASDREVTKYLSWEPHASLDVTKMILALWINLDSSKKSLDWIIVDKLSRQAIGAINVNVIDKKDKKGEVGFCIARKYWNQGIMTEALAYVLKHVFSIGFKEIIGGHVRENIASAKVMIKNRMRYAYTVESKRSLDNSLVTIDYYAITYNDYKVKKGRLI